MVFQILGAQEEIHSHPLYLEALDAGIISNPHPKEHKEEKEIQVVRLHLQIENMWCASCAEAIACILSRKKGVSKCVVDYATDLAIITFNPLIISKEAICAFIKKIGYEAVEFFSQEKKELSKTLWLRFALAAFCSMNLMMLSYPLYAEHFGLNTEGYSPILGWVSCLLALPLISYCCWPIWRRLYLSLKTGFFGMETLVFIGVSSSFIASLVSLLKTSAAGLYFDSMSMLITFVLLGKILEKKAKFSAKETYARLTRSLPKKGYKKQKNGTFSYVPIKEIDVGDHVLSRAGEKILLDGEVISGEALVDEAVMTGESVPIQKRVGAQLIAGSIVKQGSCVYEVKTREEESLLGKIIQLIEKDLDRKKNQSPLIDRISKYFVPLTLLMAILACFVTGAQAALTLLLIACPCAIGIAIPLAESRLLYRLAEKGALVRNRSQLKCLAKNPFFVFDKTGTLTEGKFSIVEGLDSLSTEERSILNSLASFSLHPISFAIASRLSTSSVPLENLKETIGRGVEGVYCGKHYLLGSEIFLQERGVSVAFCSTNEKTTQVFFAEDHRVISSITLLDRLREKLPKVEGGILSGDSQLLVNEIAQECGFLWGKGGMNPLQKRAEVEKLKRDSRPVVVVGDGINDAPAMSVADLGISVVSASEIAIEVSDILLTTEYLSELPLFCDLVKKTQKVIYQNLFWAFFYNGIGIVLAFLGLLNPFFAAVAMALSSLSVSLNSLRI